MADVHIPNWLPYQFGMWYQQTLATRCVICRTYPKHRACPSDRTALLCSGCHGDIAWHPSPLALNLIHAGSSRVITVQSAAPYTGTLQRAMVGFKYRTQLAALPALVHAIRQLPRPSCHPQSSVIVPMPTTHERLKKRGTDTVLTLAYYLSQHWQIPLWTGVTRIDDAHSQQGLSKQERRRNVHDAFVVTSPIPAGFKHLVLFDDVVTTGSTLLSLAGDLLSAQQYDEDTQLSAYTILGGKS